MAKDKAHRKIPSPSVMLTLSYQVDSTLSSLAVWLFPIRDLHRTPRERLKPKPIPAFDEEDVLSFIGEGAAETVQRAKFQVCRIQLR